MALTFPLALSAFSDKLGIATLTPRQGLQQELSSLASGDEIAADLSPAKREYDVTCIPMYHSVAAQIMALIESLRGAMHHFYITDPRYPAPAADPGGALLLSGSPIPVGGIAALGDFTTGAYALDGVAAAQSDVISFTRASTGTYFDGAGVMQTAAANVLRIDHDPVSHAASALIEAPATNLCLQSGDASNAAWAKHAIDHTTGNAVLAPDGTMSGAKVVPNTTNDQHYVDTIQLTGLADNAIVSGSVHVKMGDYRYVILQCYAKTGSACAIEYDFVAGTFTTILGPQVSPTFAVDVLPNGWVRLKIGNVSLLTGATNPRLRTILVNSAGATTYAGDGTSGTYVWGGQFELGPTVTSYIPTTTAAVTRAADAPVLKALGTNSWSAILDDGSSQSLGGAVGNLSILPANLNRPRIKSYKATRTAMPGPSTVTINSLNVNNKAMSLAGLPPGYIITAGDFLHWDYGSSPTRRAYFRAAETVQANGLGVTPEFQLTDFIKPGSTTGLVVTLIKAAFKAKLISGSVQEQAGQSDPMFTAIQFSVRQAL